MKHNVLPADRQRLSLITVNRLLLVIILCLALLAGYFHAKVSTLESMLAQDQTRIVE